MEGVRNRLMAGLDQPTVIIDRCRYQVESGGEESIAGTKFGRGSFGNMCHFSGTQIDRWQSSEIREAF